MTRKSSIVGVVATSILLASCLDFAPLTYDGPATTALDASVSDAVADVVTSDALIAECRQCLITGACASPYAACQGNAVCGPFAVCMTAASCWSSSLTDRTHLSPCIVQCAVSAGLTSQTDPAVNVLAPLLFCAQDPSACGNECAGVTDR